MSNESNLTADDADYLAKYLAIVDRFIDADIKLDPAIDMLATLNKDFDGRITPNIKRTEIIASNLADYDGWVSSECC